MKKSLLKEIIKNELKKLFEVEPDPNTEPELNIGDKIEPEDTDDGDQVSPPFALYHIPIPASIPPPAIAFIQSSPEERQPKLSLGLFDCVQELKLSKHGFVG